MPQFQLEVKLQTTRDAKFNVYNCLRSTIEDKYEFFLAKPSMISRNIGCPGIGSSFASTLAAEMAANGFGLQKLLLGDMLTFTETPSLKKEVPNDIKDADMKNVTEN